MTGVRIGRQTYAQGQGITLLSANVQRKHTPLTNHAFIISLGVMSLTYNSMVSMNSSVRKPTLARAQ
eukprot:11080665-Alexandrium_andersonii.AAC.1